jgi:hypothetical protein
MLVVVAVVVMALPLSILVAVEQAEVEQAAIMM